MKRVVLSCSYLLAVHTDLEPSLEQTLGQVSLAIQSFRKELMGFVISRWFVDEEPSHNAARTARWGARQDSIAASDVVSDGTSVSGRSSA